MFELNFTYYVLNNIFLYNSIIFKLLGILIFDKLNRVSTRTSYDNFCLKSNSNEFLLFQIRGDVRYAHKKKTLIIVE